MTDVCPVGGTFIIFTRTSVPEQGIDMSAVFQLTEEGVEGVRVHQLNLNRLCVRFTPMETVGDPWNPTHRNHGTRHVAPR